MKVIFSDYLKYFHWHFDYSGRITVNMYGYLHDLRGTAAQTFAAIPKHDWCRLSLVVDEHIVKKKKSASIFHPNIFSLSRFQWFIYINCLRNWNQPIKAVQKYENPPSLSLHSSFHFSSPIYYYHADEYGTFVLGGTDVVPSFRGYITQMDIYRRVALTYEQVFPSSVEMICSRLKILHFSYRKNLKQCFCHRSFINPINVKDIIIYSNNLVHNFIYSINVSNEEVNILLIESVVFIQ